MGLFLLLVLICIVVWGRLVLWAFLCGLLVVRPILWKEKRGLRWMVALMAGVPILVLLSLAGWMNNLTLIALLAANLLCAFLFQRKRSNSIKDA
jgi:hypothetical protein